MQEISPEIIEGSVRITNRLYSNPEDSVVKAIDYTAVKDKPRLSFALVARVQDAIAEGVLSGMLSPRQEKLLKKAFALTINNGSQPFKDNHYTNKVIDEAVQELHHPAYYTGLDRFFEKYSTLV